MSETMDKFIVTMLQHYEGTVKNSLQQAIAMNTRNISSMTGITSNLNESDLSKLAPQLGSFFPDADEMTASIEYGSKMLTVTRQLEAIKQKNNVSDKEALKIREEMGKVIATYAEKEEKKYTKKIKSLDKLITSANIEITMREEIIAKEEEELSLLKELKKEKEDKLKISSNSINDKEDLAAINNKIREKEKGLKNTKKINKEDIEHFKNEVKEHTTNKNKNEQEQKRYEAIRKNHDAETKILKVIDKQLVSARSMVKAQLAVNVARGKMTMKDAAMGIHKTGGSFKDIASVAMNASLIKVVGETAFKLWNKGSDIKKGEGAYADKGARPLLGIGIQVGAAIIGAATAFFTIVSKGAMVFAKVVEGAVNFLKKGFSSGIEGLMQGIVDIVGGLAQSAGGLLAFIPVFGDTFKGLGEAASKIISSFGGLLVQVRMFQLRQSELRSQEKWAVYGRTGRYEDRWKYKDDNNKWRTTNAIDNRGLPPNLMIPWVNALAQQGVHNRSTRNTTMDLGASMGMDAGETASQFGVMRETVLNTDKALKRLDQSFAAARNSARQTGLATTVFTEALNKAGVAARYMQVDFGSMIGLMNNLVGKEGSGQGLFAAFGQNIKTDLSTILEQAANYGKNWGDATYAFAGQSIYGGAYKGNVIGGLQAAKYGKDTASIIATEGWEGLAKKFAGKDNSDFTGDLNARKMWIAVQTANKAGEGKTGDEKGFAQEKALKELFGDISPVLISKMMGAFKEGNGTEEGFITAIRGNDALKQMGDELKPATQILSETNKVEILQYKIQTKIAGMVGLLFKYLNAKDDASKTKIVDQLGQDMTGLITLAGGELLGEDGKKFFSLEKKTKATEDEDAIAKRNPLLSEEEVKKRAKLHQEIEQKRVEEVAAYKNREKEGGVLNTLQNFLTPQGYKPKKETKHSGGAVKFHSGGINNKFPTITALGGEEFNIHSAGISSGATTMEVKSKTQVGREKLENRMSENNKSVVINFNGNLLDKGVVNAITQEISRLI